MEDGEGDGVGRRFNFQGTVSLGNVLIIVSMLLSVAGTLLFVGREIQGLVDTGKQLQADLLHETEMRVVGEKVLTEARIQGEAAIVARIGDMANQESRDIQAINATLQDLRTDLRDLSHASGPMGKRGG